MMPIKALAGSMAPGKLRWAEIDPLLSVVTVCFGGSQFSLDQRRNRGYTSEP